MYGTPLYVPVWPNSTALHRFPPLTSLPDVALPGAGEEVGAETDGDAFVGADDTAGSVAGACSPDDGEALVPAGVVVGPLPHGAMVAFAQFRFNRFLIRPASLWSIDKFQ